MTKRGYGTVSRGTGRQQHIHAHRFVYELFNGPIPDGMLVCHRCDVTLCVNPAHLFLGTPADNSRDMVAKGRSMRGSRQHLAVLTEEQAVAIRNDSRPGLVVAKEYGVANSSISSVRNRKTWRHV